MQFSQSGCTVKLVAFGLNELDVPKPIKNPNYSEEGLGFDVRKSLELRVFKFCFVQIIALSVATIEAQFFEVSKVVQIYQKIGQR